MFLSLWEIIEKLQKVLEKEMSTKMSRKFLLGVTCKRVVSVRGRGRYYDTIIPVWVFLLP